MRTAYRSRLSNFMWKVHMKKEKARVCAPENLEDVEFKAQVMLLQDLFQKVAGQDFQEAPLREQGSSRIRDRQ